MGVCKVEEQEELDFEVVYHGLTAVQCCTTSDTHQVEWERLYTLAAQSHLQQLSGQKAQQQHGHESQRHAEAQESQEAALAACPSVLNSGLPERGESPSCSMRPWLTDFVHCIALALMNKVIFNL